MATGKVVSVAEAIIVPQKTPDSPRTKDRKTGGKGLDRIARSEHKSKQEFVPRHNKHEEACGHDAWPRERENHSNKSTHRRTAIHQRSFVQFARK